jgi:hypothetical protein
MTDLDLTDFEMTITQAARGLAYPPTPDLAGRVSLRIAQERAPRRAPLRLGWAVGLAALALVALLLAAPPVRAALAEFLQIGVIRIFTGPPTAEATPTATPVSPAGQGSAPTAAPAAPATPAPPPTAVAPLALDVLAGETTLEEAQRAAPFPVRVPAALGAPDRVFVQNVGSGPVVTLAWLDGADATPRAVLQLLGPGALVWKENPATVQETTVGGRPALWLDGPYVVMLEGDDAEIRHLVTGRALLWEDGGVTYRLETALPLEEAVAVAESMTR